jgi:O-antigen ligase/polysaccharide polymerase Wzy-like membrane protein
MTDMFETARAVSGGDRYLGLLAIVLLGYALMGKGFAYLGLPPLYVGEIALLAGAVVFLRAGALAAALTTLPSLMLVILMIWVTVRMIPCLGVYGFDSLRDSTIVMYGGFAFVMIGLLLEDARRINTVLRYYNTFLTSLPALFAGLYLTRFWADDIPRLYGPVPIVDITTTAAGTHLAGTMIFILIGNRKVSFLWLLVWFATMALASAINRGAMLSVVVPVAFAMIVLGRFRLLLTTILAAVSIFAVLLVIEDSFTQYNDLEYSAPQMVTHRQTSAHQIVENARSIVGTSGNQTEGTKQWRLRWWDIIINDTFYGPNFWTGRGFGINLADADGFAGADPHNPAPPTRSPHNAHMTLLARAGVPGLVLWSIVLISWFGMQLNAMLSARARGHERWVELFLFVTCYAAAIIINATFDVALEGPMQGVWFWCLFGFGVGSVMIYRAQPFNGFSRVGAR